MSLVLVAHGFVRHAKGNFTIFGAPDALYTASSSINGGCAVTESFFGTGNPLTRRSL